jgi:hypothetical protein
VFGAKLWFVLFGLDAAEALVLLQGASGPSMGHCVLKIDKTVACLISDLNLVEKRVFPLCTQPIFGVWLPCDP